MSDLKRTSTSETSSGSLNESGADEHGATKIALSQYDPEEIERIWKKVDWHIMPVAILLYLSSYIDRYVRHGPDTRETYSHCAVSGQILEMPKYLD